MKLIKNSKSPERIFAIKDSKVSLPNDDPREPKVGYLFVFSDTDFRILRVDKSFDEHSAKQSTKRLSDGTIVLKNYQYSAVKIFYSNFLKFDFLKSKDFMNNINLADENILPSLLMSDNIRNSRNLTLFTWKLDNFIFNTIFDLDFYIASMEPPELHFSDPTFLSHWQTMQSDRVLPRSRRKKGKSLCFLFFFDITIFIFSQSHNDRDDSISSLFT